jgi:hypothetical protein
MKTLLKPSLSKIILTFVLFVAASYLWRMLITSRITDVFPLGFPLPLYVAWGPCPPGESCSEFNKLYLMLDIVIWYVISAFIISLVKKEKSVAEKDKAK